MRGLKTQNRLFLGQLLALTLISEDVKDIKAM